MVQGALRPQLPHCAHRGRTALWVQIFCDAGKRSHFRDFAQFPDPDRTEVGNCHSSIRLDVASRPLDRGAPRRAVVAGASSRMMPSRSTRRQPVAQPIEIASVLTRRRRAAPLRFQPPRGASSRRARLLSGQATPLHSRWVSSPAALRRPQAPARSGALGAASAACTRLSGASAGSLDPPRDSPTL